MSAAPTKDSRGRHPILGFLVLSITLCMYTNIFKGHGRLNAHRRYQRYQYEKNFLPPQTHNKKRKGQNLRMRHFKDELTAHAENITEILRGEIPFPSGYNRMKYRPGDLKMSSTEALQYCYVDATLYRNHMRAKKSALVSESKHHKLIYRNVPKSASSSARYAMENHFHGEDVRMDIDHMVYKVLKENNTLVSFVREPLDRFYSSYDEAYFRWGPWMGSRKIGPGVAKNYHKNKHKMDKYSFLYDGMKTLGDYHRSFCPEEVLHNAPAKACNEIPSIDNGTLTERFERFVREYDGIDPFDIHLTAQVAHLVDGRNGQPLPITVLYNASEANKGWQDIADARGVTIPKDGLKVGRMTSRRFNLTIVSNATKQKICRLMALDYCCLNIELPEVCRMSEDDGVYCAMEQGRSGKKGTVSIQPW